VTTDADAVAPLAPPREVRWLLWFARALALVFFVRGVQHWLVILGAPGFGALQDLTTAGQVLTGHLAVVMVLAAVGLWLGASWGIVVWLMAALSEIVAHVAFADLFGSAWALVAAHLGAMIIYVAIAWRIAQSAGEDT
jgi:hypothetical protein